MRKAGAKPVAVHIATRTGNRLHLADVVLERNRGRADILVRVEVLPRPIASQVGQGIAISRGTGTGSALDLDQMFGADRLDKRHEDRVRKPEPIGDADSCRLTGIQRLDEQL